MYRNFVAELAYFYEAREYIINSLVDSCSIPVLNKENMQIIFDKINLERKVMS